jgi:competence protein ComEA
VKLWQGILTGVFLELLVSGVIILIVSPPRGKAVDLLPLSTPSPLVIYVTGAVMNPGTYNLPANGRVRDAIQAAGGLSSESDITSLNLAAFIQDGERIWVPLRVTSTSITSPEQACECKTVTPYTPSADHPLNINLATEAELDLLPGIGSVKAAAIVTYRQQNGPFTTIDELQNVPGITATVFANIKDLISVSSQP